MLSYFNVKKAMDFYVCKGGSAKFIICDDGFQVCPMGPVTHCGSLQAVN
jgi:hypothetical protein